MNESSRKYITEKLLDSIATMESFCRKARRTVGRRNVTPEEEIAQVCHSLMWGLANANAGISSAFAECSRDREHQGDTQ